MRSIAFAALLAATVATPALAQDESVPFIGPRIEALGGVDQMRGIRKDEGVTYGIGAGYDMQVQGPRGPIFGVEASLTDSTAKLCNGAATAASPRVCANAGRDIYAGVRAGAPVLPNTLIYAKAGYTNAQFTRTIDRGAGRTRLDKGSYDGWRIGGGIEYALSSNMFVKAEATVSDYTDGFARRQAVAGFGMRF